MVLLAVLVLVVPPLPPVEFDAPPTELVSLETSPASPPSPPEPPPVVELLVSAPEVVVVVVVSVTLEASAVLEPPEPPMLLLEPPEPPASELLDVVSVELEPPIPEPPTPLESSAFVSPSAPEQPARRQASSTCLIATEVTDETHGRQLNAPSVERAEQLRRLGEGREHQSGQGGKRQ